MPINAITLYDIYMLEFRPCQAFFLSDDSHPSATPGADQRIDLVGLPDHLGPVLGGEEVIDGTEKTLLPGLIDAHVHIITAEALDFEGQQVSASFGAGWMISADIMAGGKSKARMRLAEGGAEGSAQALLVAGETVPGGASLWAGAFYSPGPFSLWLDNFRLDYVRHAVCGSTQPSLYPIAVDLITQKWSTDNVDFLAR
jgi:hypothetical protein